MIQIIKKTCAIILAFFGILTLFLSSSVIFDLFGVRAREGNYVLFVVWSNFLSSIIYLFAAYGFLKTRTWTVHILLVSEIILIIALLGLKIHIDSGGIYESKTIGAMFFRISVTLIFLIAAWFTINYFDNLLRRHVKGGNNQAGSLGNANKLQL